jgi:hypothetical protein
VAAPARRAPRLAPASVMNRPEPIRPRPAAATSPGTTRGPTLRRGQRPRHRAAVKKSTPASPKFPGCCHPRSPVASELTVCRRPCVAGDQQAARGRHGQGLAMKGCRRAPHQPSTQRKPCGLMNPSVPDCRRDPFDICGARTRDGSRPSATSRSATAGSARPG